jgi:hypothetical protein
VLCLAVYYVAMCLEICAVFQIRCFRLSKVLPADDAVAAKIDYSNGCYNSQPAAEK